LGKEGEGPGEKKGRQKVLVKNQLLNRTKKFQKEGVNLRKWGKLRWTCVKKGRYRKNDPKRKEKKEIGVQTPNGRRVPAGLFQEEVPIMKTNHNLVHRWWGRGIAGREGLFPVKEYHRGKLRGSTMRKGRKPFDRKKAERKHLSSINQKKKFKQWPE